MAQLVSRDIYVRYIMLSYVLYLVASISDINRVSIGHNLWSFVVSTVIAFIWLAVLWLTVLLWSLSICKKHNFLHKELKELFNGVENNFISRGYLIMYLVRRILLCSLVTVDFESDAIVKLSLFLSVEVIHAMLLILIRPFCSLQDNLVYIFNSLMMVAYAVWLYVHKDDEDWPKSFTYVYLSLILANSSVIALVGLGKNKVLIIANFIANVVKRETKSLQVTRKPLESKPNVSLCV